MPWGVFDEHSMLVGSPAPLLAMCAVLSVLCGCDADAEDRSADYEAEFARIERAKPQPEPPSDEERARQLRNSKKVRSPGGGWHFVPRNPRPIKRTATAAVDGCDRGGNFAVPHPPGITARRVRDELTLLVTYRVGDAECRPTWLEVTADVSDDFHGGSGLTFRINEEGQIELPLQGHVANADLLVASSWTPANGGLWSEATTIRLR
jgi:hypothetical protein